MDNISELSEEQTNWYLLEKIAIWLEAILVQGQRVKDAWAKFDKIDGNKYTLHDYHVYRVMDEHFFLIAANIVNIYLKKMTDIIDLRGKIRDNSVFSPTNTKNRKDLKDVRDMREHEIDYIKNDGDAQHLDRYIHSSNKTGIADASATFEDKLGGRVSVNSVILDANELLPIINSARDSSIPKSHSG